MKKIDKFFKLIVSLVIFFIILPPMLSFFVLNLSNLNKRNVIKQKVINASRMPYMHTRNIWQSHCTIYDEILLYYPKNDPTPNLGSLILPNFFIIFCISVNCFNN